MIKKRIILNIKLMAKITILGIGYRCQEVENEACYDIPFQYLICNILTVQVFILYTKPDINENISQISYSRMTIKYE